jgi:hypothetical protein
MIHFQLEMRDKCVCFVLGRSSALEIGGWEVVPEERDPALADLRLGHCGIGGSEVWVVREVRELGPEQLLQF